jgi:spore germination protein PC
MSFQQVIEQLYAHIGWQAQRIEKLENAVTKLQAEVDVLKEQKRFHIDKIEYNFDQLKVEKLEGSLSIGISPSTFDDAEDFTVNGSPMGKSFQTSPMANLNQDINGNINDYLNTDAKDDMRTIEAKMEYPLEESYKQLILDDIKNQVETRIQHYVNQYRSAGFQEPLDAIKTNIINQTKSDIRSAIESYISGLSQKEGEQD